jgi:hypothetical protein
MVPLLWSFYFMPVMRRKLKVNLQTENN